MTVTSPPKPGTWQAADSAAGQEPEPMAPEQSAILTEFARACRSAARSVSLYPGAHPAIGMSLSRLVAAAARLVARGEVVLVVHPAALVVDGRTPQRPDPVLGELAALLHERLVGTLRIAKGADADDWRALLLLLARSAEELIITGGLAKAWAATGRAHFEIGEIDYAEVLREREGDEGAAWDRVIANCLRGESVALDDSVISALVNAVKDPAKFGALLDRLQDQAETGDISLGVRVAALFQLLRAVLEAVAERRSHTRDHVLDTAAQATPHLTPDMLLGIIEKRASTNMEEAEIASGIVERITDEIAAGFVARAITQERGATERLAQAFSALVPQTDQRLRVLDLARADAEAGELGRDERFVEVWAGAADMLTSYTDSGYVAEDYARELTVARSLAVEVERLSDDPPERIQAWLESVDEAAVKELALQVMLDLLVIEDDPAAWGEMATVAVAEAERRTLIGDVAGAQRLAESLVREAAPEGRPALAAVAARHLEQLASGVIVRHVVTHLRKAPDREVEVITRFCLTIGPSIVRPLAEALALEDHIHTIRRLRELLRQFGLAGRQAVEPLRRSMNPAVRRTAIDLLRVFGGNEALKELAPLLHDADPEVRKDSVRVIAQIGTKEGYAVLTRACDADGALRELIVGQLIALRDAKAIPPLCHVLATTAPRGASVTLHESILEALGGLGPNPESIDALKTALHRSEWWAPMRTASLRHIAAVALRRIGSADALTALTEAAEHGSRAVRKTARAQLPDAQPLSTTS